MKKFVSMLLLISVLMSCVSFTAFASNEVYITAADAECTKTGTWSESTNPGCLGPNKENTWYATTKADYVTYSASKLEKEAMVFMFIACFLEILLKTGISQLQHQEKLKLLKLMQVLVSRATINGYM